MMISTNRVEWCCSVCFFFFQAEDGIRDLVRSRGLGDVYKRQGTTIEKCVIMGADYFEQVQPEGSPQLGIGQNCVIKNAIIDKNARIGNNVQIVNRDQLKEYESEIFSIRDEIVVIPKNTTIPEGMII